MSPAKTTVSLDATVDKLRRLGLNFAAEGLHDVLTAAVKNNVAHHGFVDQLLAAELEQRETRRIATSLRLSGLPTGYTLGTFDWAFQPSINRAQVETLGTCAWIRETASVLLQGPPGVGKTHLAIALGVKAVEHGFSVAYFRLEDLLHAMKKDADIPPTRLRRKKYLNVSLLIIDEVGFQPLSRQEANLFFRMVSYRYQRSSTIITTNKSVKDWPEMLAGDEAMTAAILDRLLHRCHVINIKGRSYRLKELQTLFK